jgi:hypothetical protein
MAKTVSENGGVSRCSTHPTVDAQVTEQEWRLTQVETDTRMETDTCRGSPQTILSYKAGPGTQPITENAAQSLTGGLVGSAITKQLQMEQGDENVKDKGERRSTQRYGRYPSALHCEHCKKRSKKSHGRSPIQRPKDRAERRKS